MLLFVVLCQTLIEPDIPPYAHISGCIVFGAPTLPASDILPLPFDEETDLIVADAMEPANAGVATSVLRRLANWEH